MLWIKIKRIIRSGFFGFWRNGFVSLSAVLVMTVTLFVIGSTIFSGAILKGALNEIRDKVSKIEAERREKLEQFGTASPLANQLVDLAFLANNMLKGEALANFVKRSIELIK